MQNYTTSNYQHNFYVKIVVPWLVTLGKGRNQKRYQTIISGLLPEVLRQNQSRKDAIVLVLSRWQYTQDNQDSLISTGKKQVNEINIKTISNLLKIGIKLHELGWLIALILGIILTSIGVIAVNISNNLNNGLKSSPLPSPIPTGTKEIDNGIGILLFPGANVSDTDSPNFNTGKLTVKLSANATPADRLFIYNQGTNPGEIGINGSNVTYGGTAFGSFSGGDGKTSMLVTFNSNSTIEAVQALSRNISYKHTPGNLNTGTRAVQVQLTDGSDGKPSNTLNKNIIVTTENKEPIVTVPQPQTVKENTSLAIKGISISDTDSQKLTVTLSVNNGILKIKPSLAKGLTANNIPKNNAKTVTIIGSVAQINTILADPAAVIYQGTKDFNGNDSLTVAVSDGGKVGKVGTNLVWPPNALKAKTNRSIVNIAVKPINILPTITVPNTQTVKQNTSLAIKDINITDPDSKNVMVTLSVKNGTLTIKPNVPNGLKASNFSNQKNNASVVTFNGTVAQINSTLADPTAITYLSKKDSNSNDTLSITASDGGKKKTSNSVTITIQPINRPPVLSLSEVKTINNGNSTIIITKQEAVNLVNRYLQAKERIFAPPFDIELAKNMTTGNFYRDITKPEGRIDWLKQNNAYYKFGQGRAEPLGYFLANNNQLTIDVKVKEQVYLYKNDIFRENKSHSTNYRFILQYENGLWKIAEIPSQIGSGDSE